MIEHQAITPNPKARSVDDVWFRGASVALALYIAIGGLISFAGWAFNVPRFTDWVSTGISIQPNTSIAVIATGLALIAVIAGARTIATLLSLLVAAIGLSSVFQIVTNTDLGINTILMFDRTWGREGVVYPGRMGTPASISWTILGFSLLIVSQVRVSALRPRFAAVALALITLTISTLSLAGYLYGASALYTIPILTSIALQTASFIFAASAAVVLSVTNVGPARLLGEQSVAGVMARRVIPALLVLPIFLGFLRLAGQRAGLYDVAFGTAARTLSEMVLLLVLFAWAARAIRVESNRNDLHDRNRDFLFAVSEKVRVETNADELLRLTASLVGEYLDVHRSFFNEIDLEADTGYVRSDYCRDGTSIAGRHKLSDYSSVTSASMVAGKTIVNRDSKNDHRTSAHFAETYGPNQELSYVAVPLMRNGKWVASLWCSDDKPRDWTPDEVSLLENIAERSWSAVERLRVEGSLRESEGFNKRIADELRDAYLELDARVKERTKELAQANSSLEQEVEERRVAEKARVELIHRVVTSQEDERQRISRDLHDQLGQRLTALRLKLAALRNLTGDEGDVSTRVKRLQEIAATLDSEVSFLSTQLRPAALDDLGLEEALRAYAGEWSEHYEIGVDFHSNLGVPDRLGNDEETHLYRIAQEALNNIVKHANADSVAIMIERAGDDVVMVIEDNGSGFPDSPDATNGSRVAKGDRSSGLGLVGMRERANLIGAEIEFESRSGEGTAIYLRIPVNGRSRG